MDKKKILLIDDEPEFVDVVRRRLEANGYDVISALNGREGMEKILNEKPDLVLLDIRMPKMDGYTFVKEIRVHKELKNIPVIILSVVDRLTELLKLEGVTDYVEKPFDAEILVQKVNKYLGRDKNLDS